MMRAEGSMDNEILPEYIFDAADECEDHGSLAIRFSPRRCGTT